MENHGKPWKTWRNQGISAVFPLFSHGFEAFLAQLSHSGLADHGPLAVGMLVGLEELQGPLFRLKNGPKTTSRHPKSLESAGKMARKWLKSSKTFGAQVGDRDEEGHEEAAVGADDDVLVQAQPLAELAEPIPLRPRRRSTTLYTA